ncbi:MAG: imidazoleglycerol-phosphate dehydratase HisB [Fimbriimonadaceae bacterium]
MSKGARGIRYAEVDRETAETRVQVVLDLDGGTRQDVSTGVPFLNHMLALMAFHGRFDLGVTAEGDLDVDDHHVVEDVGIVLGQAFRAALAETESFVRYGSLAMPMDEALVLVAVDVSGRGAVYFDVPWQREKLGALATENVREFLKGLATHAGITIHVRKLAGENDHHVCEAIFKGLGRALREALSPSDRAGIPSTKGKLD